MVPETKIIRIENNKAHGMFGVLLVYDTAFCVTLEPPWKENEINVSCIPAGRYLCTKYTSRKYPATYQVNSVPGRTRILFHPGNTVEDTTGCVILGQYFGKLRTSQRAILNSGNTFRDFIAWIGSNQNFWLEIETAYGHDSV